LCSLRFIWHLYNWTWTFFFFASFNTFVCERPASSSSKDLITRYHLYNLSLITFNNWLVSVFRYTHIWLGIQYRIYVPIINHSAFHLENLVISLIRMDLRSVYLFDCGGIVTVLDCVQPLPIANGLYVYIPPALERSLFITMSRPKRVLFHPSSGIWHTQNGLKWGIFSVYMCKIVWFSRGPKVSRKIY